MKKVSVDNNGVVSTAFYSDEKNKTISVGRSMNHQSVLDHNKKLYNLNDGYNKKRDLKRVASIPIIVLEVWAKEYNGSSNWFSLPKEVQKSIMKKKLNSNEFQLFKTAHGNI
tara:strand:+ start:155 stop:490 length:336 start_codon:yes stop_codon:yes gene_type:complete